MIKLLCTSKLKTGPELDIIKKFLVQIKWPIEIIEFQSKKKNNFEISKDENAFFKKQIKNDNNIILLDELGENLSSIAFSKLIESHFSQSEKLCFIIGGASGISQEIRQLVPHRISFGKMTWPHLLCRIMLIEQIFRAQSILNHHPYHREGQL